MGFSFFSPIYFAGFSGVEGASAFRCDRVGRTTHDKAHFLGTRWLKFGGENNSETPSTQASRG